MRGDAWQCDGAPNPHLLEGGDALHLLEHGLLQLDQLAPRD